MGTCRKCSGVAKDNSLFCDKCYREIMSGGSTQGCYRVVHQGIVGIKLVKKDYPESENVVYVKITNGLSKISIKQKKINNLVNSNKAKTFDDISNINIDINRYIYSRSLINNARNKKSRQASVLSIKTKK